RLDALCPGCDGSGIESELRGYRDFGVGAGGEVLLPEQSLIDDGARAVTVDVLVALRMSRDVEALEAHLVEQAGLDQLNGAFKLAGRRRDAATQKKRLLDVRFRLVALQPIFENSLAGNAARRDMRHDRKALGVKASGSRDHVLDRSAVDMGDVD